MSQVRLRSGTDDDDSQADAVILVEIQEHDIVKHESQLYRQQSDWQRSKNFQWALLVEIHVLKEVHSQTIGEKDPKKDESKFDDPGISLLNKGWEVLAGTNIDEDIGCHHQYPQSNQTVVKWWRDPREVVLLEEILKGGVDEK